MDQDGARAADQGPPAGSLGGGEGPRELAAYQEFASLAERIVEDPRPPSPLPDKLYAVIDGTGVPMTSRKPQARKGKGEDGRARTRKDGLTVFFTQDKLNKDGGPTGSWTCSTPASTSTTSPGKLEFMLLDRKDEWLAARLEDPGYDYFEPNAQ